MSNKYKNWTMGQMEALLNKLGGEERAKLLLSDKLIVADRDPGPRPPALKIDRSKPFDPAILIAPGWTIWCGPEHGQGLEGEEDQDKDSLSLTEIDPACLFTQTGLRKNELKISGHEKRRRLGDEIQLDAKIGEAYYREKGQETLNWLKRRLGTSQIEFPGTVIRRPDFKARFTLNLAYHYDGLWKWGLYNLDYEASVCMPSLCVALSDGLAKG